MTAVATAETPETTAKNMTIARGAVISLSKCIICVPLHLKGTGGPDPGSVLPGYCFGPSTWCPSLYATAVLGKIAGPPDKLTETPHTYAQRPSLVPTMVRAGAVCPRGPIMTFDNESASRVFDPNAGQLVAAGPLIGRFDGHSRVVAPDRRRSHRTGEHPRLIAAVAH